MSISYPPRPPERTPDPRIFRAEGQTFLVGETIFLRGLEEEDAQRASGWRDSPYPINAERAGELIKEQVEKQAPGQRFLVACRRSDGEPVGSLTLRRDAGNVPDTRLSLHADPARPDGERIRAEMLGLIVRWGFGEAELPKLVLNLNDDQTTLRGRAEAFGLRRGALWRDGVWRDGQWRDRVRYEGFHPAWLATLGDPGTGIDHAMAADDPSRWRPRQFPTYGVVRGNPPTNAVMVGPRVYLRPLEITDASGMTLANRRESETFMDEGRFPWAAAGERQVIRSLSKDDPPTQVLFAVCLRETGEHIGANGVVRLDLIDRTAGTASWFHDVASRNQGYGSEAKQLLLAYAFERLGLHSVTSWVWGPNGRSAAALRKQGYRECGRQFWDGIKNGQYTHAYAFDFLADEWREMTARAEVAHAVAVAQ